MLEKVLTWCGNVLLAGVLVLLVFQNAAFAQDSGAPNGGDEPGKISIPLSGAGYSTAVDGLQIQPASFDTGVVQIGDSRTQGVTIKHAGDPGSDPIEISSANLFGNNVDEYQTDFVGFVTLSPGESIDFDVVFTPTIPGTKSAGIRMEIAGATSPHILLFNGWSRYPLTSDLGVATAELNFGQAIEGENKNNILKLTNLGETEAPVINVSSIDLSGDSPQDFIVNFNPVQIIPGQTVDVPVTMSAANKGLKSANVLINHDGNNPSVETKFTGEVVLPDSVPINFGNSKVANVTLARPTSIQFGPDGNLYVAEMDGPIKIYAVARLGKNNYTGTLLDTINHIKNVPNHNDDGQPNPGLNKRLLTGIFVTGTAAAPVIYAASSDPRQGGGDDAVDLNLDTNSGILHKLTKNGANWNIQDLVRGLPRSEENHVSNGLLMYNNKILLNVGGHTNMGAPSEKFVDLPEYALSAAILEIDVAAIGNGTHDLPTLDDEDRPGANDANDPFGGNDGKNQAKLVANSPVQLFATGFRNAFDITLSPSGQLYVFDNGPNPAWGSTPVGNCTNDIDEAKGGVLQHDNLHLVTKNYYAGHPNPTRGNKNNTFNDSNPQSPVEVAARPAECNYKNPSNDGSLYDLRPSTNGIDFYTASNFLGSMQGDLIGASYFGEIFRFDMKNAGTEVDSSSALIILDKTPVDATTMGDNDQFPGTIWVVENFGTNITVLEPSDY